MHKNSAQEQAQTVTSPENSDTESTDPVLSLAQLLPFPDLNETKKRLLVVSYDPEHALKSVTDRCVIAGVSRRSYYRAIHDPDYLEASKEMSRLAFEAMQPEMIARYTALARSSEPGSGKAIERILEQGDHLKDKAGISINLTLSAEQVKEVNNTRLQNQAEGLRMMGITPPDFLQVESPSNGNGKSVGRLAVREATNPLIDPLNENGRMQDCMVKPPPASTTTKSEADDDF